jgi:hypothetical protein
MLKYCYKCTKNKDINDFAISTKRKDGRQSLCKACKKSYDKIYFKINHKAQYNRNKQNTINNRILVNSYKVNGCKYCNEKDVCCLDFHHRNSKDKILEVSNMLLYSAKKIIAEIKKCDVVCANCHRKLHAGKLLC